MNYLILSDEAKILELTKKNLGTASNAFIVLSDRQEIWDMLNKLDPGKGWAFALENFQLLIVSWVIGKENSLSIIKKIREHSNAMMLILGDMSKNEITEVLNAGADDQLPVSIDDLEFMAHVNSLSRRAKELLTRNNIIQIGDIRIDLKNNEIRKNEVLVPLSKTEYQIIHYLAWKHGRIISSKELADIVLRSNSMKERKSLLTHTRNIRRKLGMEIIKNYPKKGFTINTIE